MALFRRGKKADDAGTEPTPRGGTEVDAPASAGAKEHGPWDRAEVGGIEGRLDLGSLWLPGIEGMELRLELDQSDGSVVGVSAVLGESALQLQAFAAPRTLGIWDDIRDEIVESIRRSGGAADVVDGPFGTQIAAQLPQADAYGRTVHAPVAFLGVDGPRWFLRGFLSGPAVTDPEQAGLLLTLFAETVVVRGDQAMAPRELLPLRLPEEMAQAAAQPQDEAQAQAGAQGGEQPTFDPLERGPEITEVR